MDPIEASAIQLATETDIPVEDAKIIFQFMVSHALSQEQASSVLHLKKLGAEDEFVISALNRGLSVEDSSAAFRLASITETLPEIALEAHHFSNIVMNFSEEPAPPQDILDVAIRYDLSPEDASVAYRIMQVTDSIDNANNFLEFYSQADELSVEEALVAFHIASVTSNAPSVVASAVYISEADLQIEEAKTALSLAHNGVLLEDAVDASRIVSSGGGEDFALSMISAEEILSSEDLLTAIRLERIADIQLDRAYQARIRARLYEGELPDIHSNLVLEYGLSEEDALAVIYLTENGMSDKTALGAVYLSSQTQVPITEARVALELISRTEGVSPDVALTAVRFSEIKGCSQDEALAFLDAAHESGFSQMVLPQRTAKEESKYKHNSKIRRDVMVENLLEKINSGQITSPEKLFQSLDTAYTETQGISYPSLQASMESRYFRSIVRGKRIKVSELSEIDKIHDPREFAHEVRIRAFRSIGKRIASANGDVLDSPQTLAFKERMALRRDLEIIAKNYIQRVEGIADREFVPEKFMSEFMLTGTSPGRLPDGYLKPLMSFERREIQVLGETPERIGARKAFDGLRGSFLVNLAEQIRGIDPNEIESKFGVTIQDIAYFSQGKIPLVPSSKPGGKSIPKYNVHHIVPLDLGGSNDPGNFILVRSDSGQNDHHLIHDFINAQIDSKSTEKQTVSVPRFTFPIFTREYAEELKISSHVTDLSKTAADKKSILASSKIRRTFIGAYQDLQRRKASKETGTLGSKGNILKKAAQSLHQRLTVMTKEKSRTDLSKHLGRYDRGDR